jgi:N-acetylmuramoyl-L-alanine amidase-like protein
MPDVDPAAPDGDDFEGETAAALAAGRSGGRGPWLPRGAHWDLNLRRAPQRTLGEFHGTPHWKFILHTTESQRDSATSITEFLGRIGATAHLVFGYDPDTRFPVVYQCAPLNHAVLTLRHPAGTPETNRAHCIQMEICGRAGESHTWSDNYYRGLANVIAIVRRRVSIPLEARARFVVPANRLSGEGFVRARGFLGHGHVPNNDHWDPGALDIGKLLHLIRVAERENGLNLRPVNR